MEPAVDSPVYREAVERPDMVSPLSPPHLRVVQITADNAFANSHVYMESHVFTPDSRRFVFARYRRPDGENWNRMGRVYALCDLDDGASFREITDEEGAVAPSVSPDGKWMYYFADRTKPAGGWWALKRLDLSTLKRETLARFDAPLPGVGRHLARIYALSSISSDGRRLCTGGFFGDGETPGGPWGVVVCDLETAAVEVVLTGSDYCNVHPQYCRSTDAHAARDILVQHNHGCEYDAAGRVTKLTGGAGADIHVIRDDGTNFRSMPWGRDGVERCQGHQAWRGRMLSAVTSIGTLEDGSKPLIEGRPVEVTDANAHDGKLIAGGLRNDLGREMDKPTFSHFAFDPTGTKFISDIDPSQGGIVIATVPDEPEATLRPRFLLNHRSSFGRTQPTHPHPFLSPDGRRAFFNSDEPGRPHVWMVEGFEFPD